MAFTVGEDESLWYEIRKLQKQLVNDERREQLRKLTDVSVQENRLDSGLAENYRYGSW